MRDFTPEEKELIINTPIDRSCFDFNNYDTEVFIDNEKGIGMWSDDFWEILIEKLETLRKKYNVIKGEQYFIELVRLLPNTYKVVKL